MWTDRLSQSTPCYFGAVSLDFMQQGAIIGFIKAYLDKRGFTCGYGKRI